LVVTTLVLIAGFSVLSFSTFSMNSDMGIMTAIAIAVALITDFLLLPAILITYEKEKKDVLHKLLNVGCEVKYVIPLERLLDQVF